VGRKRQLVENLWSKADVRGDDECWNWQGHRSQQGYGVFCITGGARLAHRQALALHQGIEVPPSKVHCLHACDNRACINPKHLRWGSNTENMKDRGERNANYSWIESEEAIFLVRRCLNGETRESVAREAGISVSALRWWVEGRNRPEILQQARKLAAESQTEQLSLF